MDSMDKDWKGRPVWVDIQLDALTHNLKTLAGRAPHSKVMAVVKANAYGHGAVPVARAALEAGAHALCVICVDEGEQLRRAGIEAPIVVLGWTPASQADVVVEHRLSPALHDLELAHALSQHATRLGRTVDVHLEVETGLNRHGLPLSSLGDFARTVQALPGLNVAALFTHFAAAEEGDKSFTHLQFARLQEASQLVPWVTQRHCAATASIMDSPSLCVDMVRAGLGMYGYHPAPGCGRDVDVRPVLSLKTRVARIQRLQPGDTVGYGRVFRAQVPTTVGLLMAGYADGLPRRLSGLLHVLVRGQRTPVLGRIAMDMCMVDLTAFPDMVSGEEVVLLGQQGAQQVDADELASLAGGISWEILAGIPARVPRRYWRDGKVVQVTTLNEPAR